MTVSFRKFNTLIPIMGFLSTFSTAILAQSLVLGETDKLWIADRIFANECNRQIDCLTSWNAGENFPSLGIGHFIWYQPEQNEIYTESFPELLAFYAQENVAIPSWLSALRNSGSPWGSRQHFYSEYDGHQLVELRQFLHDTMSVQADFILLRQQAALPKLLSFAPESQRQEIEHIYRAVAASNPPYGLYALVDYVNFKGEGISASERYQDQGWGLLQVLQQLLVEKTDAPLLHRFSTAANKVLERRVANSPIERNEQRWLPGWRNRVAGYIPPAD